MIFIIDGFGRSPYLGLTKKFSFKYHDYANR